MQPEVWWVVPKKRGVQDPPLVSLTRDQCAERGWPHRLIRPCVLRNSAGKPFVLLEAEDANNLYQRLHRARICVLTTVDVFVQLNPTRKRLDPKWLAKLSRLVRYKAFYRRLPALQSAGNPLVEFENWATTQSCDDERDPRVLPLHIFCPSQDCNKLDGAAGRAEFADRYGAPRRRISEQQLVWTPDRSAHGGREPQNVAGLELTPGFHWDLTGERQVAHLLTLVDVWEVRRRRHVNVYPNGHVRAPSGGRRVGSVRS